MTLKDDVSEDTITIIRVRKSTRERLKRVGKKGETYDDVVNRILDLLSSSNAK